jgi:hypothetical protein
MGVFVHIWSGADTDGRAGDDGDGDGVGDGIYSTRST